ncbi:MAG: response regulator transcription factor [Pseudomonadota bacterium]
MIEVGLVDDQALVRQGIAQLIELSDAAMIAWQAEDGEQALARLSEQPVDVLVCDIRMPGLDGLGLVKTLRGRGDQQPVLMLTTFDDHALFIEALSAGANGFLLKDVTLEKLIGAVAKIASGGFVAEPRLVSETDLGESTRPPDPGNALSGKERDVLRLVAGGLSNREIAEVIHLAEGTIKNHVSNILTKLNCRDRTQAVLYAIHWRLI